MQIRFIKGLKKLYNILTLSIAIFKIIDIEEVAKELRTIEYDIKKAKDAHNVFLKELGLEQLP